MPVYAFDLDTETWLNYDPDGADLQVEVGLDLDLGKVVYSDDWIASWSSSDPGYSALASSYGGNTDRVITSKGTAISTLDARNSLHEDAPVAKTQAILWKADGNEARRSKVIEILDSVKDVRSFSTQQGQDNLVAGWFATNLCQAAAITGYDDPDFKVFLRDVIYPMLDWPTGGNWHASFADSRLAIASYLRDPSLWVDARAYLNFRMPQTIYHSSYDGDKIVPLRNGDWPATASSTIHSGRTYDHWGAYWGAEFRQIESDFTAAYQGQPLPDGCDAERLRDLAHPNMTLVGFQQAISTVLVVGDTVPPHVWDRMVAAAEHHGERTLHYIQQGVIPDPQPAQGEGGSTYLRGWYGLRRLLGEDCPEIVHTLCARPEVKGQHPVGANHTVADRMADSGGE